MRFKVGHRVQEKYRPHRIGTVIEAQHDKFFRVKIKGGGIQATTGRSFNYLSNIEYEKNFRRKTN